MRKQWTNGNKELNEVSLVTQNILGFKPNLSTSKFCDTMGTS